MNRLVMAAAAFAMLAGAPAFAQVSAKNTTSSMTKAVKADDKFFEKATILNMTEVAMANVALQRSQNAGIKQHAQAMVTDHEMAQRQLEQVAGKPISRTLDSKHNKMVTKLHNAKAGNFDREYANAQLKAHQEAISLHEKAAKANSSNSLPVRQLATTMLPKLHEHQGMTTSIGQQVGASKFSS